MKALSIKQPWAWLIVNGYKNIENRTWKTKFRGEFLVHASKSVDKPALKEMIKQGYPLPREFDIGGIVGKATLVDCRTYGESKWFQGPVGFYLKDMQTLPFKPCKGMLNFFEVDYEKS